MAQVANDLRTARLTVEQVHAMLEAGILREGEPIELIDGKLVLKDRSDHGDDPMTIGKKHNLGVQLLARLSVELEAHGGYIQLQGPVSLPPYDEPEPDGAVVRGTPRDYSDRLPIATDVHCVIEVSDSSLATDRTAKLAIYAGAGIAQYVIVNLRESCVEVHERPIPAERSYADVIVRSRGDVVRLRVGGDAAVDIDAGAFLP
jgi:Uma2 family endonuclease